VDNARCLHALQRSCYQSRTMSSLECLTQQQCCDEFIMDTIMLFDVRTRRRQVHRHFPSFASKHLPVLTSLRRLQSASFPCYQPRTAGQNSRDESLLKHANALVHPAGSGTLCRVRVSIVATPGPSVVCLCSSLSVHTRTPYFDLQTRICGFHLVSLLLAWAIHLASSLDVTMVYADFQYARCSEFLDIAVDRLESPEISRGLRCIMRLLVSA
jgi:hypothetical protein